jgi:hypothetical protein
MGDVVRVERSTSEAFNQRRAALGILFRIECLEAFSLSVCFMQLLRRPSVS